MAYKDPGPLDEGEEPRENKELDAVDRAGRQEAAINLRIHGASFTEIAQVLDYASANHARLSVERGLAKSVSADSREQQRFLVSRRLERLLRAVMPRATDEADPDQLGYARTALAIIDRHARLHGVDAPQEMVVYSPSKGEIDALVDKWAKQVTSDAPEEYDVIEGQLADDVIAEDRVSDETYDPAGEDRD